MDSAIPPFSPAVTVGLSGNLPGAVARPSRFLRYALYAFVFTIPYEAGSAEGNLQLPTVALAVLLVCSLIQPRQCFRWPPSAFWWFACWLGVWVISGVLYSAPHADKAIYQTIVLAEMLILFWVSFNLMRDDETARGALISLAISCGVLAFLQLTGITATPTDVGRKVERLSALGQNPNHTALVLSLGMLTFLALPPSRISRSLVARGLIVVTLLAITVVFMKTGSRGGLVALALGLVCIAANAPDLRTRIRNVSTVVVALGALTWFTFMTATVRDRIERTLESGSLSKREDIYPLAWQMMVERPVLGWGPAEHVYELGSRLSQEDHETRDTHNVVLHVVTATGIIGLIPITIGFAICVVCAWRARRGPHQVLPFAMVVMMIAANMHTPCLFKKSNWFVMAYAVASGVAVSDLRRRRLLAALLDRNGIGNTPRSRWPIRAVHVLEIDEPGSDAGRTTTKGSTV